MREGVGGRKGRERDREKEKEREEERERNLLTIETVQVVEAHHQSPAIVRVDVMLCQHLFQIGGSHQK